MKRSTRKNIIGITFGVLIVSGSIGSLAYANGANAALPPSKTSEAKMDAAHADVQLTPEELAKHVSETFKVSEAEVKQAIDAKKDLADIGQAAMFAKISGKSFRDVMAMKEGGKTWEQIADSLNITEEAVQKELDEMAVMHISMQGEMDVNTARTLYNEGYEPHDIEMAGILAKASGKDVRSVLERKNMKNRWEDIAKELGVNPTLVRPPHPDAAPANKPPMKK
ncbi:Tat pathway signal sequence domain protein [Selenomonas noxia]|uniref:Tat pathway signal sequence domain protein n=1 Tax=Selenomonas noxia TaxID=135083 RepID=UPI00288A011E|nr:Tat pathway signal sequence domain protein [Selenomonas noxia]